MSNNSLKLIVFDCDGVLFDSREANRKYYNDILRQFHHPAMAEEDLNYVHSHNVMDSIRHLFRDFSGDYPAAESLRKSIDYRPYLRYMKMEPDLIDFLRKVRPCCKTAISTNRTTTMSLVLEQSHLTDYFDMVVTAKDVANPKPHPEALMVILGQFKLTADEAIYIGDSQVDRDHTASLGMRLIAYKNVQLDAEYHVSSFMEILDLPLWDQCHLT